MAELPALPPDADTIVLAVLLTRETLGLVDGDLLDRLPVGALDVNVSRGAIVNTDDLLDRVRRGLVRSALDVVDPEPLPADHPLWSLPGSLMSAHLGGTFRTWQQGWILSWSIRLPALFVGIGQRMLLSSSGAKEHYGPHWACRCDGRQRVRQIHRRSRTRG
jgi:lactate dehydrogenase-like 2-hydroxyacid dehydrogenase